jgi:hypothetical protein
MTTPGLVKFEADDDIGVAELLPAPSVSLSLALSAMAVCDRQYGGEETRLQLQRLWGSRRVFTNCHSHKVIIMAKARLFLQCIFLKSYFKRKLNPKHTANRMP